MPVHLLVEPTLPASSGAPLASLRIPTATLQAIWPGSAQAQWIPGSESSGSHLGPQHPFRKEQGLRRPIQ